MTQLPGRSESESTEKLTESERLRRSLNVSSLEHTFQNFHVAPELSIMYKTFRTFAEKLIPAMVLLHGGIGNGKTFMLEATAIRLRQRGVYCRVSTWSLFIGLLHESLNDRNSPPYYDQVIANYRTAPVILMDDYGMGTTETAWEKSALEDLTSYRYHNHLPTVLSTNDPLDILPARVVSRFRDPERGVVVQNLGGDYRVKED